MESGETVKDSEGFNLYRFFKGMWFAILVVNAIFWGVAIWGIIELVTWITR